jgi:hypothetical protein
MRIFHRGKHRAPRGCRDHVKQIAQHYKEVEHCEAIMCQLSNERDDLIRQRDRLVQEITELRNGAAKEPVLPPVSVTAMLQRSTLLEPLGPSEPVRPSGRGRRADDRPAVRIATMDRDLERIWDGTRSPRTRQEGPHGAQ